MADLRGRPRCGEDHDQRDALQPEDDRECDVAGDEMIATMTTNSMSTNTTP